MMAGTNRDAIEAKLLPASRMLTNASFTVSAIFCCSPNGETGESHIDPSDTSIKEGDFRVL